MERLNQLITLKRAATNIEGAEAYFRELYAASAAWTEPGTRLDLAALTYDALIDRAAHDTDGTEQPSEAPRSPELVHPGQPDQPATPTTPQTGAHRLNR